jgi:sulfatase modifying factor 1
MSPFARLLFATSTVTVLVPPELQTAPAGRAGAPLESALAERTAVLTLRAPASLMIRVPAGTFVMGSTSDDVLSAFIDCQHEPAGDRCESTQFNDEAPPHRVTLSAYWLDRTEVTVAEYGRCVGAGACRALPLGEGARRFDHANYPASLVTWDEARAYCNFRGARLPTEAEFERAARGTTGRRYPWGTLYNSRASNHGRLDLQPTDDRDDFAELAPVGSFPAGRTSEGFLDLAGNVGEWVSDRYAPQYEDADVKDPQGPPMTGSTPARVVRGGGYESPAPALRGAARQAEEPGMRRPWIGFRCARSARSSG